jgi:hypothetical protein
MGRTDRSEEAERETSTAVVVLTPTLEWVHMMVPLPRPDPSFVTQLIDNAERVSQAGRLRPASSADARLAYGDKHPLGSVSARTRQVA